MYESPEKNGNNSRPKNSRTENQIFIFQMIRLLTAVGCIGIAIFATETLINPDIIDTFETASTEVSTNLGLLIVQLRDLGFNDSLISASIFGIAGVFILVHAVATEQVNYLKNKPRH